MTSLAFSIFDNPAIGMWMFLSVGAVALFVVFIPTVTFLDNRRKEREAYYRAESLRRITEASGESGKAAIDLMRDEGRLERQKKREGMKIGGLVNLAVGVGLSVFLGAMHNPAYLVGLIPGLIGVALLTYALFLAPPVE